MVTQQQIDRINELSRKSKTPEGLTEEEKDIVRRGRNVQNHPRLKEKRHRYGLYFTPYGRNF